MSVLAAERSLASNRHEICRHSSLRAVESPRAVAHAESTRFNPVIVPDPGLRNLRKSATTEEEEGVMPWNFS